MMPHHTAFALLALLAHLLSTPAPAQVRVVTDALDAALAILDTYAAGRPPAPGAWQALFTSEGYQRLAERERAMGRAFSDSAFRAFLASDSLRRRLPAIRTAAAVWTTIDAREATRRAAAYLPTGTPIRANLYPLIKPQTNSFVHRGSSGVMGIFMYIDTEQPATELEATLAHELHHVGVSAACRDAPRSAGSEALQTLVTRLGGFGEGLAMLAAAGSPDIHPNGASRESRQLEWDRDMVRIDAAFAEVERLVEDVVQGRLARPDSIVTRAMTLYGAQGPWYTVGWFMASSVERTRGRPRLVELTCDPVGLMMEYNALAMASDGAATHLPRWNAALLAALAGGSPGK